MLQVVKGKPTPFRGLLEKLCAYLEPESRLLMLAFYLMIKPEVREFFGLHEGVVDRTPFIVVWINDGHLNVLFYVWDHVNEKVQSLEEAHLTTAALDMVVYVRDFYAFHDEGDLAVMLDPPDFSRLKPVGKVVYAEPVGMWTDPSGTLNPSLGISFPRESAI